MPHTERHEDIEPQGEMKKPFNTTTAEINSVADLETVWANSPAPVESVPIAV